MAGRSWRGAVVGVAVLLTGCVQAPAPVVYGAAGSSGAPRPVMIAQLAAQAGIAVPPVAETDSAPGLPDVTRVTFADATFFDFDADVLRPDAGRTLDVMATALQRDVRDASLTLVGHTDAVGSDAYNDTLALRRAQAVLQALVQRGAPRWQLSAVPMGRRQPVASNATEAGRARNRRVEFLLSPSLEANLAVVRQAPSAGQPTVAVYRPMQTPPGAPIVLAPAAVLELGPGRRVPVAAPAPVIVPVPAPYAVAPGGGAPFGVAPYGGVPVPYREIEPEPVPAALAPERVPGYGARPPRVESVAPRPDPVRVAPAPARVPERVTVPDVQRAPLGPETQY